MICINKITNNQTVDYAAEELRKYLKMMSPTSVKIAITDDKQADNGFRLGLMQDFGLDVSDVKDVELDDIIYIDADENGGIIAGDNPRSVLLAVYEFLRQNGCRWLFVGKEGEYIPVKKIDAVKYRHVPSMRYRGPCIEGAVSREIILDTIDFLPKVGMNLFMLQFLNPFTFFKRYYNPKYSTVSKSKPISQQIVLQWKSEFECEMEKRGIQFHDIGHGWTAAPFGVDVSGGWATLDDSQTSDETRQYLAMLDGKRGLYKGRPINTQFCMSSPKARKMVADYIAGFAEDHPNVDYIHVWLADSSKNHCECDECRKKQVSDWYVVLLNDIDRALTEKGLKTRIVYIVYTDTTWAPQSETLNNPDRFTLMLAPITRSYTKSTDPNFKAEIIPFELNKSELPKDLDSYLAYFDEWRKGWNGSNVCFEYHFWRPQFYNPSNLALAGRIWQDVEDYKSRNVDGLIACGTQRSYFPNGLAYYVFARKQFDISLSLEEITEEYFSLAYGEDWKLFYEQLERVNQAFGAGFMAKEESLDERISPYYNPERAEKLSKVPEIAADIKALVESHSGGDMLIRNVSLNVLSEFADYVDLLSRALFIKAMGRDDHTEAYRALVEHMSKREIYIEKYYDQHLAMRFVEQILTAPGKTFSFT